MVDKCDKFGKTQNNVPKSKKNVICHKKSKKKTAQKLRKIGPFGKIEKMRKIAKKENTKKCETHFHRLEDDTLGRITFPNGLGKGAIEPPEMHKKWTNLKKRMS